MTYKLNSFNFEEQLNREWDHIYSLSTMSKPEYIDHITNISNRLGKFLSELDDCAQNENPNYTVCISVVGSNKNSRNVVNWIIGKCLNLDFTSVNILSRGSS